MTSPYPPATQTTPSSTRRHGHRRSAAISGDFDIVGLGLFSPPPASASAKSTPSKSFDEALLDRHFHFNNEEDFKNPTSGGDFAFPSKTPDLSNDNNSKKSPSKSSGLTNVLNSPIKLNHRRSLSAHSTSKTKFFMTEATTVDNQNVPDAVIDLDEVINPDAYPSLKNSTPKGHKRTELTPADFSPEADLFSAPRFNSSPFISSPLSAPPSKLFHNSVQEQVSDPIVEDEEESDLEYESDHEKEFPNPHATLNGEYLTSSANSSSSCVNNKGLGNLEKCRSNSSRESSYGNMLNFSTPPSVGKRSGAMANRYQSFYDQSYKISNVLKMSSSESVNMTRSSSTASNLREPKGLGHSSSLSSLKSNFKNCQPSKLGKEGFLSNDDVYPDNKDNNSSTQNQKEKLNRMDNYELVRAYSSSPNEVKGNAKQDFKNDLLPFALESNKKVGTRAQESNLSYLGIIAPKSETTSPASVASTVKSSNGTFRLTLTPLTIQDDCRSAKVSTVEAGLHSMHDENTPPAIIISHGDVDNLLNESFTNHRDRVAQNQTPLQSKSNVENKDWKNTPVVNGTTKKSSKMRNQKPRDLPPESFGRWNSKKLFPFSFHLTSKHPRSLEHQEKELNEDQRSKHKSWFRRK